MNDVQRLDKIQADLQRASTVIYLEGKTDPEVLFALLGVAHPTGNIYQDVYVVGLGQGGSGGTAVQELSRVAGENSLGGQFAKGGIFGVIDGDGRDLVALQGAFDPPYSGPMFSWKAYCIENLLAKSGWSGTWGASPNWTDVLGQYAPYAALNRVHRALQTDLETLGLHRFRNPQLGQLLETVNSINTALGQDKALIANRDVQNEFNTEVTAVQTAIGTSLDEGHALINGKWFVRHYVPSVSNQNEQQCRQQWLDKVRGSGGLAEVRDWWKMITGSTP